MTLATTLDGLKAALAAAMPSRVVTRDFKPHDQHPMGDLIKGVVTLLSLGEGSYSPVLGRQGQNGNLRVLLVGLLQVAENAPTSAVEDAEFALVEEIKAFCNAPPAGVAFLLQSFSQSGQMEHPYGWISVEAEVLM